MEQIRVALVDNSDVYRKNLKSVIERGGIHVIASVIDGEHENIFKSQAPDIVLVRYKTSLPSNINSACWIRKNYAGGRVSVILYSMFYNKDVTKEAKAAGIKTVLFQQNNEMSNINKVIESVYHTKTSFKVVKKLKALGRKI